MTGAAPDGIDVHSFARGVVLLPGIDYDRIGAGAQAIEPEGAVFIRHRRHATNRVITFQTNLHDLAVDWLARREIDPPLNRVITATTRQASRARTLGCGGQRDGQNQDG